MRSREPGIPIAASIAWGALFVPGLFSALFTPMMFDAPGSASNPQTWLFAGAVLSFPIVCAVSVAGAWLTWRATRSAPSGSVAVEAVFACLPLPYVMLLVAVLLFWTVATPMTPQLHETMLVH